MSTVKVNGSPQQLNHYEAAVPTPAVVCRGVRGAITVDSNSEAEILEATRELLSCLIQSNEIDAADVASAYFTTTVGLNATYPALAARQLGWYDVALLCGHEMNVPGGLPRCIRVLIHWNTTKEQKEITHCYLREARSLRPDIDSVPKMPEGEAAADYQEECAPC